MNGSATTATQDTVVVSTANGASTPLTINMMITPKSFYWANHNMQTSAINIGSVATNILRGTKNAANINANCPILTGTTLLPVANLQLNKQLAGIATPGTIAVIRISDKTSGSPERNLTSVYTFSERLLKGGSIGCTSLLLWWNRAFHYDATTGQQHERTGMRRTLHYTPNGQQFNLITSHARKLGCYHWITQLNIADISNRYTIKLVPNATTGFNTATAIIATFDQQPRAVMWTKPSASEPMTAQTTLASARNLTSYENILSPRLFVRNFCSQSAASLTSHRRFVSTAPQAKGTFADESTGLWMGDDVTGGPLKITLKHRKDAAWTIVASFTPEGVKVLPITKTF